VHAENLTAEPGSDQITLDTLLNDQNILNDPIFQPISYNLNKLKEIAEERKSEILGKKNKEMLYLLTRLSTTSKTPKQCKWSPRML
jgi:predicted transcriptional regulator